jgi:hypothetical protein
MGPHPAATAMKNAAGRPLRDTGVSTMHAENGHISSLPGTGSSGSLAGSVLAEGVRYVPALLHSREGAGSKKTVLFLLRQRRGGRRNVPRPSLFRRQGTGYRLPTPAMSLWSSSPSRSLFRMRPQESALSKTGCGCRHDKGALSRKMTLRVPVVWSGADDFCFA